ncbi:XrtN system VIT domain-containing protein [Chitinophaga sp. 22620]|uniref:XrtN system VIT domain-containing protein n=1 Tax=Chitinophaga sp. 22620 TaxID=3453952 RepID=UPI003F830736
MEEHPKLTHPTYLAYLVALVLSFLLLLIGQTLGSNNERQVILAFAHHIIATAALLCLWFAKKENRGDLFVLVCLMYFVSCFALNRVLNILHSTTPWFAIYLLVVTPSLLLFRYMSRLPAWARVLTGVFAGLALLAYVYLALFLLPLYPISIPALFALGFSIHTFVPAVLCFIVGAALKRYRLWKSALAGLAAGLAVVAVFCVIYNQRAGELTRIYNRQQIQGAGLLPAWVEAAQRLDKDAVTERVLKSGIVYKEPLMNFSIFSFDAMPSRNWEGKLEHDPLVVIATYARPRMTVPDAERMKILEAMYNKRHEGEERLWSGRSLYTSYVSTRVRIWPELRLSYTEKAFTVSNPESWGNQEAIYTFQLPEGATVSALSLWINGREEEAVLTTKEKADTAYRTIVGVEVRDPSVVHWQEGNRVSVRVFPIEANNTRIFRIGITAPLSVADHQLQYGNITFQGPPAGFATEEASIELIGDAGEITPPAGFRGAGTHWFREGGYREAWSLQLPERTIPSNRFTCKGRSFSIKPYNLQREEARTDIIYLDVNAAWSWPEFTETLRLAGERKVKVYLHDELVDVTAGNRSGLFEALHAQRFSIFPIQEIKDAEHALLITKGPPEGPSLQDLEGSRFREELAACLRDTTLPKVRLLNLGGNNLSPYLQALKESRAFRYEQGGLLLLKVLLSTNKFAVDTETADRVVIDQAQIAIVRDSVQPVKSALTDTLPAGTGTSANAMEQHVAARDNETNAPDHLMRLFAYNHILRETGKGLITTAAGHEELLRTATEAHVVSPLSSLVVLEKQADYDRFGIKDDNNSLKNASLKSKGAVPEPHEWALIIIALLSLAWLIYQRKWRSACV